MIGSCEGCARSRLLFIILSCSSKCLPHDVVKLNGVTCSLTSRGITYGAPSGGIVRDGLQWTFATLAVPSSAVEALKHVFDVS